jgi:hypothetical protein
MNARKETTRIALKNLVSGSAMNLSDYKATIEAAGGKFISADMARNTVFFWDETETKVLSLYLSACTPENVRLSLKNLREPVVDFEPLLPTEK